MAIRAFTPDPSFPGCFVCIIEEIRCFCQRGSRAGRKREKEKQKRKEVQKINEKDKKNKKLKKNLANLFLLRYNAACNRGVIRYGEFVYCRCQ
jgi:hypothetical protein